MAYVTTKKMLLDAQSGGYAVGAFNCENMEMVQAVVAAAEEARSPVIIQTTPGTIRYGSTGLYASNVRAAAVNASVPVALHLDHGNKTGLVVNALYDGYSSIMIDGSALPFEKNVELTKTVSDLCANVNIPVEGELGRVGGKEDDSEQAENNYTDVHDAELFVQRTQVSSLAVGIGTAHGVYAKTPVLNVELLSELNRVIPVPLVLHGASGLSDETLSDCIARGVAKINFATELRIAYTNAVREFLQDNPKCLDPKDFGSYARSAVRELVVKKISICGCGERA